MFFHLPGIQLRSLFKRLLSICTICLLACLFFSADVFAGDLFAKDLAADVQAGMSADDYEHLAFSPFWLALGHYRHQTLTGSGWVSEADKAGFFLAADGKRSPPHELKSTLAALLPGPSQDLAAVCRFPARYYKLEDVLGMSFGLDPLQHCPEFAKWAKPLLTDRVSIFFASAYLENPSSMFGHTFLRFYSSGNAVPALMTPTVNFAADTDEQKGVMDFVTRGLIGGFPGVIDRLPLHRRLRDYTENQGRDLWEYGLRLNRAQVKLLVSHAWETRNGVFDYYFIDENCAFRTLALIAVAIGDNTLLDGFYDSTVPIDTVRRLLQRHLLTDYRHYWPSQTRALYAIARPLSREERLLSVEVSDNLEKLNLVKRLPADRQKRIFLAAYQYLSLEIARGTKQNSELKARLRVIAQQLQTLGPPLPPALGERDTPTNPERGHLTSRGSIGYGRRDHQNYAELSLRGAYHSWLDPLPGFNRGAEVSVLEGAIREVDNSSLQLERMILLNVKSLTPVNTYFQPSSWELSIGRSRNPLGDKLRLTNDIEYSRGRSWQVLGEQSATLLFGGGVHSGSGFKHHYGLGAKMRLLYGAQYTHLSWLAAFEQQKYISGNSGAHKQFSAEAAWSAGGRSRWSAYVNRSELGDRWLTDSGVRFLFYW